MDKENSTSRCSKAPGIFWYRILFIILIVLEFLMLTYGINHPDNPPATMITLFLVFFLLAAFISYCIININFSHEIARKIEIFGYFLLFLLIAWQLIVRDNLVSMINNTYLEMKLDTIFECLTTHPEDFSAYREYYYTVLDGSSRSHLEEQLIISNYFVVGLQLASTVCIAIGRFDDISIKAHGKTTDEPTSASFDLPNNEKT